MTTFNTALSELNGTRLQALVDAGLREGRQFEFKQQLPGGSDDDKREFLFSVREGARELGISPSSYLRLLRAQRADSGTLQAAAG